MKIASKFSGTCASDKIDEVKRNVYSTTSAIK